MNLSGFRSIWLDNYGIKFQTLRPIKRREIHITVLYGIGWHFMTTSCRTQEYPECQNRDYQNPFYVDYAITRAVFSR